MTAPTYHLWLKPPSPTYEALAGLIRALAQELTAPVFGPHVTLLGHLEGSEQDHVQRTTRLGELIKPFSIQLGPAASRTEHFKCIFLEVDNSASIMSANAIARQLFQRPQEEFMPHLSLVYGSYPEARKKQIIARLPARAQTAFPVRSVHLIRANSENPRDWSEVWSTSLTGTVAP